MKKKAINKGDLLFYIGMIAPCVILFVGIIAGPILYGLGISFTDNDFRPGQEVNFIGLEHFITIFKDPVFWKGFRNNMSVVGISVFGQIPLGLLLAYFLFRGMVRAPRFFQAMVFFPQVISTVVIGRVFMNFFNTRGALTTLFRKITGDPLFNFTWDLYEGQAMVPVLLGMLFVYTGFFMLLFLANMQKLDGGIIEAASIDGAKELQIFSMIIAPALLGIIIVNAILAISGSLKAFDFIFAMSKNEGRGINDNTIVLATYMYHRGFKVSKFAFGSAASMIIVFISVFLIWITNVVGKKLNPMEGGK